MSTNEFERFSDEYLNSFVDDQLSTDEKSRAYAMINQDEAVNRRVCELRKLRDLVQLAYKHPPAPPSQTRPAQSGNFVRTAAASLLLGLGLLVSWLQYHAPTPSQDRQAIAGGGDRALPIVSADAREIKVLFHLNSGNVARMKEVLDEAEGLLKLYGETGQPARVEIITNGDGLNLLRAQTSPYAERVQAMRARYPNLVFAACQNTIERLSAHGIDMHLLPGTIVIDSGVAQIIQRQQQGWLYIQV
ncbi:MAG TPA: hypothetical protein VGA00_10330 [Acidiferrobacterales bacterium]